MSVHGNNNLYKIVIFLVTKCAYCVFYFSKRINYDYCARNSKTCEIGFLTRGEFLLYEFITDLK